MTGVRPLSASAERHLGRARAVARLLDSSIPIPGTGRRIGLDPILGLVPFVGDFAGALLSGYIVLAAAQTGAPAVTLIRMIANVAADTLVGSVPLLGDLFDAAWKSNARNVALLETHLGTETVGAPSRRQVSRLAGVFLVVSALLALALLTFVVSLFYLFIKHALFGG